MVSSRAGAGVDLRESASGWRFTDKLRRAVGDEPEPSRVQAEAENLVAVRVEPVVREAAARTQELIDKKWRKLYTGAANAFGLAGAAYINHALLAKAVQQTLEVGALAFADPEDKVMHPKATAQFVLTARSIMGALGL